jgi:hypothetical protein
MAEQDWNRVIRNNSLMNGNVFSIVENKSREKENKVEFITKVDKAPYPGNLSPPHASPQWPVMDGNLINASQHSCSSQGLLNATSWRSNPTSRCK